MRKGEIWRARFPTTSGHVQAGERPAVIVQNDFHTTLLPTVVMIPFTASQAAVRFPATLLVHPDGQNGLTVPSVALVFQVMVVDKRDLIRRLGVLDQNTLAQILQLLAQLTA